MLVVMSDGSLHYITLSFQAQEASCSPFCWCCRCSLQPLHMMTGVSGDVMCAICRSDMPAGDTDQQWLPCSHAFHSSCIEQWCIVRGCPLSDLKCPVCNTPCDSTGPMCDHGTIDVIDDEDEDGYSDEGMDAMEHLVAQTKRTEALAQDSVVYVYTPCVNESCQNMGRAFGPVPFFDMTHSHNLCICTQPRNFWLCIKRRQWCTTTSARSGVQLSQMQLSQMQLSQLARSPGC